MVGIYNFVIIIGLVAPLLVSYIYWPSRRNWLSVSMAPQALLAFFLGGYYFLFTGESTLVPDLRVTEFYATLCFIQFVCYVPFFVLGVKLHSVVDSFFPSVKPIGCFLTGFFPKTFECKLFYLLIFTICFFVVSYSLMGTIPFFAENQFEAKFGVGEYRDAYVRGAIPFRLGLIFSTLLLPIAIVYLFSCSKKGALYFLVLFSLCAVIFLLFASLRRGLIGAPILLAFFVYFVVYRNRYVKTYLFLYFLIYSFGALLTPLMFAILRQEPLEFWDVIKGVPDIADEYGFLSSWIYYNWDVTLGKTWFGGLIPFQSDFNPSAFGLRVTGADPSVTASGGFRLSMATSGYVGFGYLGSILLVSYLAFVDGAVFRKLKYSLAKGSDPYYFLVFFLSIVVARSALTLPALIDPIVSLFVWIRISRFLGFSGAVK